MAGKVDLREVVQRYDKASLAMKGKLIKGGDNGSIFTNTEDLKSRYQAIKQREKEDLTLIKAAREGKADSALVAAYKMAILENSISPQEKVLLDKFATKATGEFSAAYQTAALEKGISSAEIKALNKLLGIEDSFVPVKK